MKDLKHKNGGINYVLGRGCWQESHMCRSVEVARWLVFSSLEYIAVLANIMENYKMTYLYLLHKILLK